MRRIRPLLVVVSLAAPALFGTAGALSCGTPPPLPELTFDQPVIVDPVRAGGEPSVMGLADGTLLYAAHAGTTHLYKQGLPDADFVTPYNGTVYVWRSKDGGATWEYRGGNLWGSHGGPGFSDPTLALDLGGNAYVAGIDLANVYVARSGDAGETWENNPVAAYMTDREWLTADEGGVAYMLVDEPDTRAVIKTTDGGATWNYGRGIPVDFTHNPIAVDQRDGALYVTRGNRYRPVGYFEAFPDARRGSYVSDPTLVFPGFQHMYGFINAIAIDRAGNIYVSSNSDDEVWINYSTDRGETWQRSDIRTSPGSVLWPWVSAGEDGHVAVSWLESPDEYYENGDWRVYAAQTTTGHGWLDPRCGETRAPAWSVTVATPDPVHVGGICDQGLNCNVRTGTSGDRRLGDYHTNAITADGTLVIAYSNTSFKPSAAISHPAFVRQSGGVDFMDAPFWWDGA